MRNLDITDTRDKLGIYTETGLLLNNSAFPQLGKKSNSFPLLRTAKNR